MVLFFLKEVSDHLCDHGGDKEIRTPDLLLARQALSQLSYTPIYIIKIV